MEVLKPDSKELKSVLEQLMHPYLKEIDLSLDRMKRYLEACGNPQLNLPPVIHVAGTNGKGSTIAFMRSALEEKGLRCHVYTSPHLVSFRERIVIAGQPVSEEVLLPVLKNIQTAYETHPLTFFEATTAATFELFAQHPADVVLLEVGMGGQFDATNVVNPVATVITPVSMDHQAFLGNTVAKIAYEKACIMKPNVPAYIAPQQPDAMEVIVSHANEVGVEINQVDVEQFEHLGLEGEHQHMNASVASAVLAELPDTLRVTPEQSKVAFSHTKWPARLQPVTLPLPAGWDAYVDGGHNESAAIATADWMRKQDKPVHVLCAMVQGKDHDLYINTIARNAESCVVMAIPNEPMSASVEDIHKIAQLAHSNVKQAKTLEEAMDWVGSQSEEGILLCCGSLYFAGKLLETFPS